MTPDRYGLLTSSPSPAAVAAFEEATHGLAAHRPSTGVALGRALAEDPDHAAAHALKGFANLILARRELVPVAVAALADARAALTRRHGGTGDERVLIDALADAVAGGFVTAAGRLDECFSDRPGVFLPFKLSHALRFMAGDAAGMLAASDRALRTWQPERPAAGYVLGCHAFALEEHGHYDAAETFGRRAVALAPDDAWGLHAVSHVHEMRGDTAAGIEWLEAGRSNWSGCNNFAFHVAWHLALFHLERGDADRVLAVYDAEVRPTATDDVRDVANAVSLLWRLAHAGVDVGTRWDDMREIACRRRDDTTLVFASLHVLTALVALGDRPAAEEALRALESKATGICEQAAVAREVGVPVARAILDEPASRGLDRLALQLARLGGSNAQRDLFVLTLADRAHRRGDALATMRIRAARRRLKADDRLIAVLDAGPAALSRTA